MMPLHNASTSVQQPAIAGGGFREYAFSFMCDTFIYKYKVAQYVSDPTKNRGEIYKTGAPHDVGGLPAGEASERLSQSRHEDDLEVTRVTCDRATTKTLLDHSIFTQQFARRFSIQLLFS